MEGEEESDSDSTFEESDGSSKFDFGPPLLYSGDSLDIDNMPDSVRSKIEVITIRRQLVGKLGASNYAKMLLINKHKLDFLETALPNHVNPQSSF